jgi:hypothetical protein
MKKIYYIRALCFYAYLLTISVVSLQCAQASRAAGSISRNAQGLKDNLRRIWYGAEAESLAAKSKTAQTKTVPPAQGPKRSFFKESAQRIRQSPFVQKVGAHAQQAIKYMNENRVKTGVGIAVLTEAQMIADTVHMLFNMTMFDEELISDEFSDAIVRIFNSYYWGLDPSSVTGLGSAFIVRSEKNPGCYFVVTAAHCVLDENFQFVQIKDSRHPDNYVYLKVEQIIVDKNNDIAILLISPQEIKEFEDKVGKPLPAIPAIQLSSIKPHKKEAAVLRGYPGFLSHEKSGIYSKKLVSKGPAVVSVAGLKRPSAQFSSLPARPLFGASGGPVIVIRDKQPQIIGAFSSGRVLAPGGYSLFSTGDVYATGVGELPKYLQEAEKIQEEKSAERKKSTVSKSKSWLDYFKRSLWG